METPTEEQMANRILVPRIALIACGSFSPPTPMHFRMFEIARDYFETLGTHEVVGGIISPTHDAYGKKGLTSGKHRCAMVKLGLQTSDWIRLSDWELSQPQWSRTQEVLQYHQNFMNNHVNSSGMNDINNSAPLPGWLPTKLNERRDPVQLKLLCGADLLESFAVPGLWADDDIEDIVANHGIVVISRSGANPEKFIFDSDILTKYQRNITLVTNWVSNEVSSTMIRRLLGRGQSVKYLLDELVLEYIKKNSLFNYKSKYIMNRNACNLAYERNKSPNANTPSKLIVNENRNDNDMEEMDETDFTIKNLLTNENADNRSRSVKVFCCGESSFAASLLPQRASGPGQAVQVITSERIGSDGRNEIMVHRPDNGQHKPKKVKIIQQ